MSVAVAGLGLLFAGCEGIEAFAARLRGGQTAGPLARGNDEAHAETLRRAVGAAVREAIDDAQLEAAAGLAVLIGSGDGFASFGSGPQGAEARPPRSPADGLAWTGWTGRTVHAEDLPGALDLARDEIEGGRSGAVLLVAAALSQAGGARATDRFSVALAAGAAPPPRSEGAAAVILVDARRRGHRRARLGPVRHAMRSGPQGLSEALEPIARDVGLVLVDGRRETVIAEATTLGRVFGSGPRRTTLASARAWLGDAGPASDLAGIAAATLCLERCVRPALPGWDAPGPAALARAEGLSAGEAPAFWPTTADAPARRAVVLAQGGAIALEAGPWRPPAAATALCHDRAVLVPIAAADRSGIEAELAALEAAAGEGRSLPRIAREAFGRTPASARLKLAIVAADARELRREVGFMRRALDKAEAGRAVRTPGGSVFAPRPMGSRGAVAFVYPGNGSAYVDLGRDVTLAFAGHLAGVEAAFDHRLPGLMGMEHVQPTGLTRPTEANRARLDRRLTEDMTVLPLVGVSYSILHTQLLRDLLGLRPDMALGYSVGECAMRVALGQWSDWRALERMLRHPALTEAVSGPMTAVRRYWDAQGVAAGEPPWASHYVRCPPEAAVPHLGRAMFLQSVLSPGEVILCGAPRACDAALAAIGAPSLKLEFDMAMHAPPTRTIRADLEGLCDQPLAAIEGPVLYSANGAAPAPPSREATSRGLARMLTEPVDFAALVRRVHADGARVFVEVGVRNTCTGWIGATLGEEDHLAVAMDVKGLDGDVAWMRAVAQLWAHHVPLDLARLLDASSPPVALDAIA